MVLGLYVTPKASRTRLGGVKENAQGQVYWRIYVTAVPESNKANGAVIAFLAKQLSLPKTSIEIIGGHISPWKLVSIPWTSLVENTLKQLYRNSGTDRF